MKMTIEEMRQQLKEMENVADNAKDPANLEELQGQNLGRSTIILWTLGCEICERLERIENEVARDETIY